jgi:Tfp pilus assembly protein PilO
MKLSLREKLMVCLLVWVVGIYLFYNYAYTPVKNQATDWVQKNDVLRKQLISAREIDENIKGWENSRQDYQEKYTNLAQQVPSAEYMPEVIDFVEHTAADSGLDLVLFNYEKDAGAKSSGGSNDKPETGAGARSIIFELTGRGSYYDIVTFLDSLQEAPRIYSVTEVALLAGQRNIQMPEAIQEGGASPAAGAQLNGASAFDPDDIMLSLKFSAYYDGKVIPGITEVDNPVEPVSSQRDNPFAP